MCGLCSYHGIRQSWTRSVKELKHRHVSNPQTTSLHKEKRPCFHLQLRGERERARREWSTGQSSPLTNAACNCVRVGGVRGECSCAVCNHTTTMHKHKKHNNNTNTTANHHTPARAISAVHSLLCLFVGLCWIKVRAQDLPSSTCIHGASIFSLTSAQSAHSLCPVPRSCKYVSFKDSERDGCCCCGDSLCCWSCGGHSRCGCVCANV